MLIKDVKMVLYTLIYVDIRRLKESLIFCQMTYTHVVNHIWQLWGFHVNVKCDNSCPEEGHMS